MRPYMHNKAARDTRPMGFTLLAILLVLAALTLLVGMALSRGLEEQRNSLQVVQDAKALAIAEFGLDRTRAYVASLSNGEVDLDRALDPNGDTVCTVFPLPNVGTEDDNLPVFDGGTPYTMANSGRKFLKVPYHGPDGSVEGAYLVRIDDNDDDGRPNALFPDSTSNTGLCPEGLDLPLAAKNNPVRDRDQSVFITVVGIYPGTDVATAKASKVLRARVATERSPAAGIMAAGNVDIGNNGNVCGEYGSIAVNGNFPRGCVCGSTCGGGPPQQRCPGHTCNVRTSGSSCGAGFGGGGGTCTANAPVPPPPEVEVWNRLNAPPACPASAPANSCIPFYYLRADKVAGLVPPSSNSDKAQVYMWKYSAAGCENPQAFARIHYPGEPDSPAAACWKLVYDGNDAACDGGKVKMANDPSLRARDPSMTTPCNTAPIVFLSPGTSSTTTSASPCDSANTLYPHNALALGVDPRYKPNTLTGGKFEYQPSPAGTPIPTGVWLVDGNFTFKSDTPDFPSLPASTLLVTGDVTQENGLTVRMKPAHRGVALLVGRDFEYKTGGQGMFLTCGNPGTPLTSCPGAAVLVNEQFKMGSNSHFQAQLVVRNAGTCSPRSQGLAIEVNGNATFSVPGPPPIYAPSVGGSKVMSWAESSY